MEMRPWQIQSARRRPYQRVSKCDPECPCKKGDSDADIQRGDGVKTQEAGAAVSGGQGPGAEPPTVLEGPALHPTTEGKQLPRFKLLRQPEQRKTVPGLRTTVGGGAASGW